MTMIKVVYFDIGDTLGVPRSSAAGLPIALDVFPYIPGLLAELRRIGLRLGVISNTGSIPGSAMREMLSNASLAGQFEEALLLFSADLGLTKDTPEIFLRAAAIAAAAPAECLYVGEDALERKTATTAGMAVAPHPLLAPQAARGETLSFAVLSAGAHDPARWRPLVREAGALPVHVAGRGGGTVYAIVPVSAARVLADAQLEMYRIGAPGLPLHADLYLVRDDLSARTGFLQHGGQSDRLLDSRETEDWLLASSADGLVLAVPAGKSIESVHFEDALHGHTLKLRPDFSLLDADQRARADALAPIQPGLELNEPGLPDGALVILQSVVSPAAMRGLIDRFSGAAALGDDLDPPLIQSRHVHDGAANDRAVRAIARELETIEGLAVTLHGFDHEGRRLFNVEADLPGSRDEWVLVTAHLDSTAANTRPYNPAVDAAPGADDDASGIAGVIAAARALQALAAAAPATRGFRFVLFNAEEHGLVGSKAYARAQAARAAAIIAVLQMDMIGYNRAAPRTFEIHAGFAPSAAVERRSLELAHQLARTAARVSPDLAPAQIYPAEPEGDDEADGRSDHTSFQERGYAACVASEDLFVGPLADSPAAEGNPDYHRRTDTFVDHDYAADIARAVAATAWLLGR